MGQELIFSKLCCHTHCLTVIIIENKLGSPSSNYTVSSCEALILEFKAVWNHPFVIIAFWSTLKLVVPVRVRTLGQIELFNYLLKSLVWLDLELNTCVPDHWRIIIYIKTLELICHKTSTNQSIRILWSNYLVQERGAALVL